MSLLPAQRELLQEFERLHEEWRTAVQAADALGCPVRNPEEVRRMLEYREAANRVHQRAMELLRDSPI